MQNNQSSYCRWSWVVALILALILLWMFLTGKGPNNTCCAAESLAPVTELMPTEEAPVVTEAFSFSATEYDFTSSGDASQITWAGEDIDGLKALLADGIKVEGDDSLVVLTGDVESEETKQQKELNAQAFFGPDVTVDNQIAVIPPADNATTAVVPPPAAKLYFGTGVHRLPAASEATLEPIVTWLHNNPDVSAIISGFHDHTGSVTKNIQLAKKRAESTYNALLNAGVNADQIEMRKPESATGDGDLSEARRVEVSIE